LFLRSTKYLDCGPFQQLYLNGGVGGSFVCVGAPTSSSTASSGAPATSAGTSSTPSSGGGLSAGAKGGIIVAAIVAGLAVIGIVLVMRRKQHPRAIGETTRATNMAVTNEPQAYGVEGIAAGRELWTLRAESRPNQVAELRGDRPPPLNSGGK